MEFPFWFLDLFAFVGSLIMLDPHLSSVGLFAHVCWQTPACFASCVDVTAEVQNLRHSPHPALRAGKMQMRSISFFCIQGRTEEPPRRDT